MLSPHTPIPSEPYGFSMLPVRYSLRSMRRRRSTDSFTSYASEESGLSGISGMSSLVLEPPEWQEEHEKVLGRALDSLPDYLTTPYVGNIPPPNLLQNLAKGILKDMKENKTGWPYTLAQTRAKLREIAEVKARELRELGRDPERADGANKRSLHRSDSMDFLPINGKDRVAAASRRMQRLDQILDPTLRPPNSSRSSRRTTAAAVNEEPPQTITITYQSLPRPLIRTRTNVAPLAPVTPSVIDIPPPSTPALRRMASSTAVFEPAGSEPATLRALKRAPSYGSSADVPEGSPDANNPTKKRKTAAKKTRSPSFLGGPLPGLAGLFPPESSSAVLMSPETIVTPHTPVRRTVATRTRSTPAGPPTISPQSTPGRVRTRSQTKADAHAATAAQEAFERESQKSAEHDKENTPSHSRRSRTAVRAKKDLPLDSPFEEIKRVVA
ncbi:hypothetical protein DACRYDRAFT_20418 [Dacryopinax primogenitus]|uniref:Uncharacterized protein n=1 Tax=Dacryopinax primogenitus (strain DJM 731) TaxID=1858805 RepID=M5GG36_DACPD|nr:uncharacterized protein DACRYDRAFT_20418 [Dacryopinax primogenitus]EJU04803.1 hypothetical protein DACRYDRAFT_20418 [Dacryopinax primogenitus]